MPELLLSSPGTAAIFPQSNLRSGDVVTEGSSLIYDTILGFIDISQYSRNQPLRGQPVKSPSPINNVTSSGGEDVSLLGIRKRVNIGLNIKDLQLGNSNTSSFDYHKIMEAAAEIRRPLLRRLTPYLDELIGRLDRYADLDTPDWDGYGAAPVQAATIQSAKKLARLLPETLPRPNVAPGADGTIGLEWKFDEGPLRKAYIDVGPGTQVTGYFEPQRGEPVIHDWQTPDDIAIEDLSGLFGNMI